VVAYAILSGCREMGLGWRQETLQMGRDTLSSKGPPKQEQTWTDPKRNRELGTKPLPRRGAVDGATYV
jgi:hypothetical protein